MLFVLLFSFSMEIVRAFAGERKVRDIRMGETCVAGCRSVSDGQDRTGQDGNGEDDRF